MTDSKRLGGKSRRRHPFVVLIAPLVAGLLATAAMAVTRDQSARRMAGQIAPEDIALMAMAIAAVVSSIGWWRARRGPTADPALEAVRTELRTLREENAKLRMQDQRALSVGRAAERIRQTAEGTTACVEDRDPEAADVLAQAALARSA
ncbi:MAG: hypothetical protein LC808_25990, partial [Actinobacteria bacterium]|nr:hypothetical protein [Actinomycetota bacterium]